MWPANADADLSRMVLTSLITSVSGTPAAAEVTIKRTMSCSPANADLYASANWVVSGPKTTPLSNNTASSLNTTPDDSMANSSISFNWSPEDAEIPWDSWVG